MAALKLPRFHYDPTRPTLRQRVRSLASTTAKILRFPARQEARETDPARRRLMAGSFAAAAAAPLSAFGGGGPIGQAENPDLIAAGARIEGLAQAYRDTKASKKEALARYYAPCAVPDELIVSYDMQVLGFDGELERDWEGSFVRDRDHRSREIFTVERLKDAVAEHGPRTKRGKIARAKMRLAEAYEQTKREAEDTCGLWAVQNAHDQAKKALEDGIKGILEIEPQTVAGVVVKARAMLAYAGTAPETDGKTWVPLIYGNRLAAEMVAVCDAV